MRKTQSTTLTKEKKDSDPQYAEMRKTQSAALTKEKKDSDPQYAEMRKSQSTTLTKEKKDSDPQYAEMRKTQSNAWTKGKKVSDPKYVATRNDQSASLMRQIRKVVEKREIEKEKDREAKEAHRKEKKDKKRAKFEKLATEREEKMNAFFKKRSEFIESVLEVILNKNSTYSDEEVLSAKRLMQFIKELLQVPCETCCCCEGLFFPDYVNNLKSSKLFQKYSTALRANKAAAQKGKTFKNDLIDFENVNEFKTYITGYDSGKICKTCKTNLEKGKIPLINPHCGIKVPDVPRVIANLSDLEERFVGTITPFMQIKELKPFAQNPQLGIKGAVINIPTDIHQFQQVLPRKFNQTDTIQIDFKRDLSHKTSYMHETIRVKNIYDALKLLLETEIYQELDIKIDEKIFEQYDPSNTATQLNFVVNETENEKVLDAPDIKVRQASEGKKEPSKNAASLLSYETIQGLNYTIFENCFKATYKGNKNFSFNLMCAYNSIMHG